MQFVKKYKEHATARGLQLPICSPDPRWQQPIAAQQVLDGYGKPNETAWASLKVTQLSEINRFLNWNSKWRQRLHLWGNLERNLGHPPF